MFKQKKCEIFKLILILGVFLLAASFCVSGIFSSSKTDLNAGLDNLQSISEASKVNQQSNLTNQIKTNLEPASINTGNVENKDLVLTNASEASASYGDVVIYSVLLNPFAQNESDKYIISENSNLSYFSTPAGGATTYSAVKGQIVEIFSQAQINYEFKGFYTAFDESKLTDYYAYAQAKLQSTEENSTAISPSFPYAGSMSRTMVNSDGSQFKTDSDLANISVVFAVHATPFDTAPNTYTVYACTKQSDGSGGFYYNRGYDGGGTISGITYYHNTSFQQIGTKTFENKAVYTETQINSVSRGDNWTLTANVKSGWKFVGWWKNHNEYYSSSLNILFDRYSPNSTSKSWNSYYDGLDEGVSRCFYYALFEQVPQVTLTLQLGTGIQSFRYYSNAQQIVTYNQSYTLSPGTQVNLDAIVTQTGYQFSQWSFSGSYSFAGGSSATSIDMYCYINGNTTITCEAVVKKFYLTYQLGTGISNYTKSPNAGFNTPILVDYGAGVNVYGAAPHAGYSWNNWSFSTNVTYWQYGTSNYNVGSSSGFADTMVRMPESNLTITCTARANTFYVAYSGNGNTGGSMANSTYTYGTSQNLRANGFSKTGYNFDGWATSAGGTKVYNNSQSVSNLTTTNGATVTLYAVWKPIPYTLTLDRQGGTTGSTSATATFNAPLPNITPPTKTGHTFEGYFTEVNGGGTQYYTVSGTSAKNWDRTTDTTLYAKWSVNNYALSVKAVFNTEDALYLNADQTVGGTVQINIGSSSAASANLNIPFSSTATITAYPSTGYYFAGWFKTVTEQSYTNNLGGSGGNTTSIETEAMGIDGLMYYAVFLKYYNVAVQNGQGITGVEAPALHNGQAYWRQDIQFSTALDSAYEWNTDRGSVWSVSSGTMPSNFNANKNLQNPTFIITAEVNLKVDASIRQYNLSAYAHSTTNGIYANNTTGGTVKISNGASGQTEGAFSTDIVDFNNTRTLTANVVDGYTFLGWFATFNASNNTFGDLVTTNTSFTTETLTSVPQGNALTYYARFVKNYNLTINADNGVTAVLAASDSSASLINAIGGSATFYFGEAITLSAVINTLGYLWNSWQVSEGSASLSGLQESINAEQVVLIGAGNTTLNATTTARPFTLNIHEAYETTTETNLYAIDLDATNVSEGEIDFGTELESLVTVPEGFTFDGFFTSFTANNAAGAQFGEAFSGATMPSANTTLYAKFTRISYNIISGQMFADVANNSTFIIGTTGGFISVAESIKYGCTAQITATPNTGFVLQGIYKTNSTSNINVSTLFAAPGSTSDASKSFVCTSEIMNVHGLTYFAVFKRQIQTITLEVGEGATLSIISPSLSSGFYYGNTINLAIGLVAGYENLVIEIFKTGDKTTTVPFLNQFPNAGTASFVVPEFNVSIKATATPILYQLEYNANGGTISGCHTNTNGAAAFGAVNYNRDNYGYYFDEQQSNLISGLPSISRVGYKLLGWNTQANGQGINYITYNSAGTLIESKAVWNQTNTATLFANWQIVSPIITQNLLLLQFEYNGSLHNIASVLVNNFIADKYYTFTWCNAQGDVVFAETINNSISTLKLRSVSQTGNYYCVVSIESDSVQSQQSSAFSVEISPRSLLLDIGTQSVVGTLSLDFSASGFSVANLAAGHSLKNGLLVFAEPIGLENQIIYSETVNKQNIQTAVVVQLSFGGETMQDGFDLISNYNIKFEGQITVENRLNYVLLSAGTYERTINPSTMEDTFANTTLQNSGFDMVYLVNGLNGFKSITSSNAGIKSNYISRENLPNYIDINFTSLPLYYQIYSVTINGAEVAFSQPNKQHAQENAPIRIEITNDMLSTNSEGFSVAELKLFYTVQAKVNYNYNLIAGEISGGYAQTFEDANIQTYGAPFSAPQIPIRNGFQFAGWFYDENLTSAVNAGFWALTGNTTVFAKWNLISLNGNTDISVEVKDGEKLATPDFGTLNTYTRVFNSNNFALNFVINTSFYNPIAIQYSAEWFKFTDDWQQISAEQTFTSLKNVSDSGEYSYSLNYKEKLDTGNPIKQLDAGHAATCAIINITPYALNAQFNISKVYDATTMLPDTYYILPGLGADSLKLSGYFISADVNLVDGVPSAVAIAITNIQANNANTDIGNYIISNLNSINGIITPYHYEINIAATNLNKIYDKLIISKEFTNTITHDNPANSVVHNLTFTIVSSAADAGLYKIGDASKFLSILNSEFVVKTIADSIVLANNYAVTLKSTMRATIAQKEVSIRMQNPPAITYDGNHHTIYAQTQNGDAWVDCTGLQGGTLPEGVISITYSSPGNLITSFVNAGSYIINATIVTDDNHKFTGTLSATLVISKAQLEFEFLYNNLQFTDGLQIEYPNGNNIAEDFSINVSNASGTGVTPGVSKMFSLGGVSTNLVDAIGTYVLRANFDTTNFELASLSKDRLTFYIIAKAYDVNDIVFTNNSMTYEARDLSADFVAKNLKLQDAEGNVFEGLEIGDISINNNAITSAINAGEYLITVKIQSKDESKWMINGDSVTATLTITPFDITNELSTVFATKTYDGTTTLPANAKIEVAVRSGETIVSETLALLGDYSSANVNFQNGVVLSMPLVNLTLQNYSSFLASNFVLNASFGASGTINQKDVKVALFSEFVSEAINTHIQMPFNQNAAQYSLRDARENGLNIVQGLIAGHNLEGVFQTTNSIVAKYPFSTETSILNRTELLGALKVHSQSTGAEIVDCINNYNVSISGGIDIIYVLTSVEILGLNGLTYNGLARDFSVKLTTKNIITNTTTVVTLRYVYGADATSGYFENETGEAISTSNLTAKINFLGHDGSLSATLVANIKDAGIYQIILSSNPNLYVFEETKANTQTLNVAIQKAQINFNLAELSLDYGANLNHNATFTGQNSEVFYLNFAHETSALDAGVYSFSNAQIFTWNYGAADDETATIKQQELQASTANINNYLFTVQGNLTINPREITASFAFPNLTYTGTNRIADLNAINPTFNIFAGGASIPLTPEIDFSRLYKFAGAETTQLKNVGFYSLVLLSKNYKFVAQNNASNSQTAGTANAFNTLEINFEITKKDLTISLLEKSDLIKRQYFNTAQTFELLINNQTNIAQNANYVSGAVNGEKIVATFTTLGAAVGHYIFATDATNGVTYTGLEIYESNGVAIIENGVNNYNITFTGGIEIVYVSTTVEFLVAESIYNGGNISVQVKLTTDATLLGGEISTKTLTYSYGAGLLLDGISQILIEDLELIINFSSEALGDISNTVIKNAGTYTLQLKSSNFTYTLGAVGGENDVFIQAENNTITSGPIVVAPKAVTLTLADSTTPAIVTRLYKDELTHQQIFGADVTGTGEIFNLVFINSETKNLSVGEYLIADFINLLNTSHNTEGVRSTAEFYNYAITFAGTLNIAARTLIIDASAIENLNLIYNGKDRQSELNNAVNLLSFKFDTGTSQINWPIDSTDFTFSLTDETLTEIPEVKNAGAYNLVLKSLNYAFSYSGAQIGNWQQSHPDGKEYNMIDIPFAIAKAELSIMLFESNANPTDKKLIEKPYVAQQISFSITAENYADYAFGVANNQYLTATFETSAKDLGEYTYTAKNLTLLGGSSGLKIFDELGAETTSNYNIIETNGLFTNITGGIKIVENILEKHVNSLQNLVYDNTAKSFTVSLIKHYTIDESAAEQQITFAYSGFADAQQSFENLITAENFGDTVTFNLKLYYNSSQRIFDESNLLSAENAVVKNAGFYKFVLSSNSSDYLFSTNGNADDYNFVYEFEVKKFIITALDFGSQNIDYGTIFTHSKQVNYFSESFAFNITWPQTISFDVGIYQFANMPLSCCAFADVSFANNYEIAGFAGTLTINPKEITAELFYNANPYNSATNAPTYAGQASNFVDSFTFKFFSAGAEINIGNNFENIFKFGTNVTTFVTNAGSYSANLASKNYKFTGGTHAKTLGENNIISLNFDVLQANLIINLAQNIDGSNQNIKKQFNNLPAIFALDLNNISQQNFFVSGAAGNEVVFANFKTTSATVGSYSIFSGENQNILTSNLKIFAANGTTEIINGHNNYLISYTGGIDIVYVTSTVQYKFLDVDGNTLPLNAITYIGQNYQFEITVTTNNLPIGAQETQQTFVYNSTGEHAGQFTLKSTGEVVSAETLALAITYGAANQTSTAIKNAEIYTLQLSSANFAYLFSENPTGNYTSSQVNILPADIEFLINQQILYGDILNAKLSFTQNFALYGGGTVIESFNLVFQNASTNNLNTGTYTNLTSPSVVQIYANYQHDTTGALSTAILSNYSIAIASESTLIINAREISVDSSAVSDLNLIYNGAERLAEINAAAAALTFKFGTQTWPLTTGTGTEADDYAVSFFSKTGTDELPITPENLIKNAGEYVVKLTSTNYAFSGQNANNSSVIGGENSIKFYFEISKAHFEINLQDSGDYIKKAYRNQPIEIEINVENQSNYVIFTPTTGEYVKISFITSGISEGRYQFGGASGLTLSVNSKIAVYNTATDVLLEQKDYAQISVLTNYTYAITGGIEIVKNLTEVAFVNNGTNTPIVDASTYTYDGLQKTIKVILCWEDVDGSVLRLNALYDFNAKTLTNLATSTIIDSSELALQITYKNNPLDVTPAQNATEIKNAGTYYFKIVSENNLYTFVKGESYGNSYELEFTINPADLLINLGEQIITYQDEFRFVNTTPYVGQNGENFYLDFNYNTQTFNAGVYNFENTAQFPAGVVINYNFNETSTAVFENYNIAITGILKINPKEININNFIIANRTYDSANWLPRITEVESLSYPTIFEGESIEKVIIKGQDYSVEFYQGANATSSPISSFVNAGTYTVKFISLNYKFVGGSSYAENNFKTFTFEVLQKEISINYTNTQNAKYNLTYNSTLQKPLENNFALQGVETADISLMGETVLYYESAKSSLVGKTLLNAGDYFSIISISNNNYFIKSGNEKIEISIVPHLITASEIQNFITSQGVGFLFKYYGTTDPELVSEIEIFENSAELIKLTFSRVAGEAVGFYKLMLPIAIHASNSQLLKTNYTITAESIAGFADPTLGGFEIKKYDGELFISQIENIEINYDATTRTNINFDDYLDSFEVCDLNGNIIPSAMFSIEAAIFNFSLAGIQQATIRNVASYTLLLDENLAQSSTHSGIQLNTNGFNFIITPKVLTLSNASGNEMSRQYDATATAPISGIMTLQGVFNDDLNKVDIVGDFINEKGTPQVNVGTHVIKFTLIEGALGNETANYSISKSSKFTGTITSRSITISGAENLFKKTYDRSSNVLLYNLNQLTVNNKIAGENVELTGKYFALVDAGYVETFDVSSSLIIRFNALNPNYKVVLVDGSEYAGAITEKIIRLDESSVLTKIYDGTTQMDISKLFLFANDIYIEDRGNVQIANATLADSKVGIHSLMISLTGSRANNYMVKTAQGTITEQNIIINYNYGDATGQAGTTGETGWQFGFVDDGESVLNKISQATARYNTNIKALVNGGQSLPQPTRTGYNFIGWFLASDFIESFTNNTVIAASSSTSLSLETLKANNYVLNLYAKWEIKIHSINIEIQTEQILSDAYEVSAEGGAYVVNLNNITTATHTLQLQYFAQLNFEFNANQHYIFSGLFNAANMQLTNQPSYVVEHVLDNKKFVIKFNREKTIIKINANTTDEVQGWNLPIWGAPVNNVVSAEIKFGATFTIINQLSRTGYTFLGWAKTLQNANAGLVEFSEQLGNLTQTSSSNQEFFAVWQANQFKIYLNYNDGILADGQLYDRAETDSTGKFISVFYDQAIGELPNLVKRGFTLNSWTLLKNNSQPLFDLATAETVLNFSQSGLSVSLEDVLTLVANWEEGTNKIVVDFALDTSKYLSNGLSFTEYENAFSMSYKTGSPSSVDSSVQQNYTTGTQLNIQTNQVVKFMPTINTPYYKPLGWLVNGTLLLDNQLTTIDEVIYRVSGGELTIEGFKWGSVSPTIEYKYQPKIIEVDFKSYNKNFGTVQITSGVYEDPRTFKKLTLTGANLVVFYSINPGYELKISPIEQCISGALNIAESEVPTGKLLQISDFNETKLTINIQFIEKAYAMNINLFGEVDGVAKIKYSINNGEFKEILNVANVNEIQIHTGDVVSLKIAVAYGYKNVGVWQLTGGGLSGGGASIVDVETIIENNQTIITKRVSGFSQALEINITLDKQHFNANANILHQVNDVFVLQSTSENITEITNQELETIASAPYLSTVNFNAIPSNSTFNAGGKTITVAKYTFLGWFERSASGMAYTLVSESLSYAAQITQNTTLFAAFELQKFSISYVVNNSGYGQITTGSGANITKQQVLFDEEIHAQIFAKPALGYVLDKWNITYTFRDADITSYTNIITEENSILPAEIGKIRADIKIEAIFKTVDLSVEMNAIFNDNTLDSASKIQIKHESNIGTNFTIGTQTNQILQIQALALKEGYVFKSWRYEKADGTPAISGVDYEFISASQIVSHLTGKAKAIGSNLKIKFVGTEGLGQYKVIAEFERDTHEIMAYLYIEEKTPTMQEIGGLFKGVGSGTLIGSGIIKDSMQTEGIFNLQFLVLAGYHYDANVEKPFEIVTLGSDGVVIDIRKISLDAIDMGYDSKFALTATNITRDVTIHVFLQRDTTTLNLFTKTTPNGEYSNTPIVGKVKYGTSTITVSNPSVLTPSHASYEFKGWSDSIHSNNFYINANGEIVGKLWNTLTSEINLYEVWEIKKVKLNVDVNPTSAVRNLDYYPELVNNNLNNAPWYSTADNAYYYYIGSVFGISSPSVYSQFKLLEYKILSKNIANNEFYWKTIEAIAGVTEYRNDLFRIENYSNFVYSTAPNFNSLGNVEDGTIYIQLVYGLEVKIKNTNFFNSNRVATIGGEAKINGTHSSGVFKLHSQAEPSKINVIATPANGYNLDHWVISGENIYPTEGRNSIEIEVVDNLSVTAVFIGKQVQVGLALSEFGQANPFSGGNPAITNQKTFYHVGDILNLGATPNVGYNFFNNWYHSNSGPLTSSTYTVLFTDVGSTAISLKPLFEEKIVDVSFQIEGAKGEVISNKSLSTTVNNGIVTYKFRIKYFSNIEVKLQPNERYLLEGIKLVLNETETDFSNLITENNEFKISSESYANSETLIFKVSFKEKYWIDYAEEQGFIVKNQETGETTILRDLTGSGKKDDPYKISSIDDYAVWAFLINNGVYGGSFSKMPYNSASTYYEVTAEVLFSSRFWTPIGTKENPFNGQVTLYENRIGIVVNYDDYRYPSDVFDPTITNQWKGLFGYLSEDANIVEEQRNFTITYIIIGAITLFVVILTIVIVIVYKRRKAMIDSLDEKNTFIDIGS